jgi:hypothetical protein
MELYLTHTSAFWQRDLQSFGHNFFGPLKEKSYAMIKIEEMEAPVLKSLHHIIYNDSIPEFEDEGKSNQEQDTRLMAEHLN